MPHHIDASGESSSTRDAPSPDLVVPDVVLDLLRGDTAFALLLDALPVPVLIGHDPQCIRITGNSAAVRLFNVPSGSNISQSAPPGEQARPHKLRRHGVVLPLDDLPMQYAGAHNVSVHDDELEILFADGEVRYIAGSARPLRSTDGSVQGVIATYLDITAARREHLSRSLFGRINAELSIGLDVERLLDHLAKLLVPDLADISVIDIVDEEGVIQRAAVVAADPAFAEAAMLLRQATPTRASDHPQARVLDEGMPLLIRDAARALLEAAQSDAERRAILAMSPTTAIALPLSVRGTRLGAMMLMFSGVRRLYSRDDLRIAEEIAARMALLLDNARLYRDAQNAVQARDAFLSIASHELKTPLTALLGQAQILQRRMRRSEHTSERDQHAIEVVVEQALRLTHQITTLFDISRLANGHFDLVVEPFDLCALVRRICGEMGTMFAQHTLLTEVPDDTLLIQGDPTRLEQVIQNLLQNAIKYSPNGTRVWLKLGREDETVALRVIDEGMGIPSHELPKLFQHFYRIDSPEVRHADGMGVGLYVVHEIVRLHGGRIDVQSETTKGSTFTVWLPNHSADQA